jgi:hypothetical protein
MNVRVGQGGLPPVSLPRLYFLRAGYLLIGVGLALGKWPLFFGQHTQWTYFEGVVNSMLTAMSILALLGVRYPLQMLPVLLFESAWKVIWLSTVALPMWLAGQLDAVTLQGIYDCSLVVIVLAVIPWRYVVARYIVQRGDRWRYEQSQAQPTVDTADRVVSR